MKSSRRGFLKFAGLSAAGVAGSAAVSAAVSATASRPQEHEPPATTGTSPRPAARIRSMSSSISGIWLPERIESPTT